MTVPEFSCYRCGGDVVPATLIYVDRRNDAIRVVEGVPGAECTQCGEEFLLAGASPAIDEILERAAPVRTIQVPVYQFHPLKQSLPSKPLKQTG